MWLNRILDEIGIGRFHFLQNILLGGINMADGAEILISASVIGALRSQWDLAPLMKGAMMSVVFVGVMFGGIIGGFLGDSWGRRPVVLLSYVGIMAFGSATAATHGPLSMLTLRLLLGLSFGTGIGPSVALVVESSSSKFRAHLVNSSMVWFSVGGMYAALLLMAFMPDLTDTTDKGWRKVVLFGALPSAVLLPFTTLLLQESPHFLLQRGYRHQAIAVVKHIAMMNNREDASQLIEQEAGGAGETASMLGHSAVANPQGDDGTAVASAAAQSADAEGLSDDEEVEGLNSRERLSIAFSPEFRCIVLGGCYMCFLANFLFYGLNYALPQVFQHMSQTYHISISPAAEMLITSMMDIPAIVLTFALLNMKSAGHRDGLLALVGLALPCQIGMMGLDGSKSFMRTAFAATYLSKIFVAAFFALTYIYLGEVFPQACRCTAFSLCVAAGRVAAILAPLIFEFCMQVSPATIPHVMYFSLNALLCFGGLLAVKFLLVYELKNAPLEPAVVAMEKASARTMHRASTLSDLRISARRYSKDSTVRMRRGSC
mmetsp:Transcript_2456/g.5300  ORF Transcript_2456/g.5300 Transcript_2456/m.5300 type:complete len:545 (-) Transcript_2456:179-1813(-)